MTQEQVKNLVQQLVTGFGGVLVYLGLTTDAVVNKWLAVSLLLVGPMMIVFGLVYGWWTNTQAGLVRAVDVLAKSPDSPVLGVIVAPTKDGKELADSLPGNTTVPAGTIQAANIAQNH